MYYSTIGLLAVLLLFFVNWDILYKPGSSYEKKAWKLYRRFLLAVLVYYLSDILWGVLESSRLSAPLFADTTVYFAAILMDIRMPEMDGLEATAAIRALDREDARRIPIIAMTANAFEEDVQRSLQAGMNTHLNKPVESEQLLRILGELIYEAEKT